ncbi:hypothetical protein GALMADRAFT_773871 [Galerina marginata CBS 339.88]|uniref:Uncharacterized protein n=1 Tax=Galerina marginata (strain CBS 339.88) TaxID=685588 RepID=A0A067SM87_GALM3|nr:hypothetical protein GALMADRAFT_773871 [Galerina marginata CBS 339.88]
MDITTSYHSFSLCCLLLHVVELELELEEASFGGPGCWAFPSPYLEGYILEGHSFGLSLTNASLTQCRYFLL